MTFDPESFSQIKAGIVESFLMLLTIYMKLQGDF